MQMMMRHMQFQPVHLPLWLAQKLVTPLAYLRHAPLINGGIIHVVRWFSLAKPRFTTGCLPCFAFGCLRFATALREQLPSHQ